jgi:hypothetical protein
MYLDWTGREQPNVNVLLDGKEVPALQADSDLGWVLVDAAFEDYELTGILPKVQRVERRFGKVEFRPFLPKVLSNIRK